VVRKIKRENFKAHFPLFIVRLELCIAFVFDTYTTFVATKGEILLHQRSHLFGCLDDNKLWRGLLQRFNLTDTRTQRPETCCAARVADMLSLSQVYCSLKMVFTTLF